MQRAPTTDWSQAGWSYRFLDVTMRSNVLRAARIRARGTERFLGIGNVGAVVAANHFTYADPVVIGAICPRPIGWLTKKEVYTNRFTRWWFADLGGIRVDRSLPRNEGVVRAAVGAVGSGRLVGIFPEGTRSKTPQLLPPKTGVARVALHAGCPIIPVGVLTDRFWPRDRKTPKLGEVVYIAVGEPIRVGRDPQLADDRDYCLKLATDVMAQIRQLVESCGAARAGNEPWPRPR
ncbi:MAG: lysophospholipid acyltransferase family protein [Thermoplasmatota archaeon]